jgi:hypothetical protein
MRDGDGRIAAGECGVARRFDVASSATGETFEVHGARPDEPAARELTFGDVPVRLAPGNWEEFPVACTFESVAAPDDDDAAALADVLRSWAALAAAGGLGVRAERDRWSGRLHSIAVSLRGAQVVALCDLGTCPPEAFEPLLAALSAFGRERRPLARVDLGGPAPAES